MSSNALIIGALFTLVTLGGCLEPAEDPRPLPRPALDGSLFDARRPPVAPGYGSGYGSGAPAPSGPSGSPRVEDDAGLADEYDAGDANEDMLLDASIDASDAE